MRRLRLPRNLPRSRRGRTLAAIGVGLVATAGLSVAVALPWDVDLVDTQMVKSGECWQFTTGEDGTQTCVSWALPLPIGVVSQENLLTPNHFRARPGRYEIPAWDALTAPFGATRERLDNGKRMYDVYCAPCHAADGSKMGVVAERGIPVKNLTGYGTDLYRGWKAVRDGTLRNSLASALEVHPSAVDSKATLASLRRGDDTVDKALSAWAEVTGLPTDAATATSQAKALEASTDPEEMAKAGLLAQVAPKLGALRAKGGAATVSDIEGLVGSPGWVLPMFTDGSVYRTIRGGSLTGFMPNYDWAMTDDEMWATVLYVRTLPNAGYVAKAPAPPPPGGEESP